MSRTKNKNIISSSFLGRTRGLYMKPGFWLMLAGFVFICVFLGLVAVRQIKINNEKNTLNENQKFILSFTYKEELNKPALIKEDNYCSYQNRKFEQGDLYCFVQLEQKYRGLNLSEILIKLNNEKNYFNLSDKNDSLNPEVVQTISSGGILSSSFIGKQGLRCGIDNKIEIDNNKLYDLTIILSCYTIAISPHFQVR